MAYVPVSRTIARRFGGEANLRMAVSKAVSGARWLGCWRHQTQQRLPVYSVCFLILRNKDIKKKRLLTLDASLSAGHYIFRVDPFPSCVFDPHLKTL